MKKFSDIMFSDLTAEELAALPSSYRVAWFMRPNREEIASVRRWMYVRSSLIALLWLYLHSRSGSSEASPLILLLVAYEFAYYILRKEKAEKDYSSAMERYSEQAKELDGE